MRTCLAGLFAVLLVSSNGQTAHACTLNTITFVGKSPADERRAKARFERAQAERFAKQRRVYREVVREGRLDAASELAAALIPNVRDWWNDMTICGHVPPPSDGKLMEQWLSGSEFEGLTARNTQAVHVNRPFELRFNRSCNEEFRAAFAAQLVATLRRRQLIRDCLELCSKIWPIDFPDAMRERRPVIKGNDWAGRFAKRHSALNIEMEKFWAAREADLVDLQRLCPRAVTATEPDRDSFLSDFRNNPDRARIYAKLAKKYREAREP